MTGDKIWHLFLWTIINYCGKKRFFGLLKYSSHWGKCYFKNPKWFFYCIVPKTCFWNIYFKKWKIILNETKIFLWNKKSAGWVYLQSIVENKTISLILFVINETALYCASSLFKLFFSPYNIRLTSMQLYFLHKTLGWVIALFKIYLFCLLPYCDSLTNFISKPTSPDLVQFECFFLPPVHLFYTLLLMHKWSVRVC